MTNIRIETTPLAGMVTIQSVVRSDNRGNFTRLYCLEDLAGVDGAGPIVQINQSITASVGALRGLHFQHPPRAEGKWIRCLFGRVFDVGVDLRRGSETFLQWHSVELSAADANAVFLPKGFAHGFQVLEPGSVLLYLHTAMYSPNHEDGIFYGDPALAIDWPLPITDVSQKDANRILLDDGFEGLKC